MYVQEVIVQVTVAEDPRSIEVQELPWSSPVIPPTFLLSPHKLHQPISLCLGLVSWNDRYLSRRKRDRRCLIAGFDAEAAE